MKNTYKILRFKNINYRVIPYRKFTLTAHKYMEEENKSVENYSFFKDLRKEATKRLFDKNKIFGNPQNLSKEDEYLKKRVDLSDEKNILLHDLYLAGKAKLASFKIFHNVTPSKEEYSSLQKIQDRYEAFYPEEEESTQKKTLNNAMQEHEDVMTYLEGELKINKRNRAQLGSTFKGKKRELEVSSDEESVSSKKSKTSVMDYIDSLPVDYNPMDDIVD